MKGLLFSLIMFFGTGFAFSQKYAYIDSDYILSNMVEYTEAKEKLDKLADRWTKEIENRYEVLKMKKDNFAREEVLLPSEERKKREEEIKTLETEAMQMQKTRFGVTGDYFQKRQELQPTFFQQQKLLKHHFFETSLPSQKKLQQIKFLKKLILKTKVDWKLLK